MNPNLVSKHHKLEDIIRSWPSALVAYSGGVDSAFLLWTAHHILGSKVTGILGLPQPPPLGASRRPQLCQKAQFAG